MKNEFFASFQSGNKLKINKLWGQENLWENWMK